MDDNLDFIDKTTNTKLLMFKGTAEIEFDTDIGLPYFEKAAELGDIKAMMYLGKHYYHEKECSDGDEEVVAVKLMKEYYLKVVKLTNSNIEVMLELGQIYEEEGNYDMMKRFYIQACEFDSTIAMEKLGQYYLHVENKPTVMIKYLEQAIEIILNKCYNLAFYSSPFLYLAKYYRRVKEYELMKKYYLLIIEKGCLRGMRLLGCYYRDVEKNYDLAIKYLKQATMGGWYGTETLHDLGCTYRDMKDYDNMKINFEKAIVDDNSLYSFCKNGNTLVEFAIYYRDIEKNYELMKNNLCRWAIRSRCTCL